VTNGADPDLSAAAATDIADRLLRELEMAANAVHRSPEDVPRTDTGWPETDIRQAS
jgi:hypothetical protein